MFIVVTLIGIVAGELAFIELGFFQTGFIFFELVSIFKHAILGDKYAAETINPMVHALINYKDTNIQY